MNEQTMCPEHGPYDGPACPYCGYSAQGQRSPQPPRPLFAASAARPPSEDDLPTDLGFHPAGGRGPVGAGDEEAPTEIPARRAQRDFLDIDEEEETQIGRARREDVTELDQPTTGTLAVLWVIEGHRRGQIYKIAKGTKIGREEGDLILDDPKVSSLHCKVTMEADQFLLWDFGSANGTFVNGKRIREATVLRENDLVKIGDTIFVVKLLEPKMSNKPASNRRTPARKPASTKKAAQS